MKPPEQGAKALPSAALPRFISPTLAIVILLTAFEAAVVFHILSCDTRPPAWDPSSHLALVLDYYFPLHKFQLDRLLKQLLFPTPKIYPPLVHLSIAALFLGIGISSQYAALVNCLFLGIVYLSFYRLACKFGAKDGGVFSMVVFSSIPMVIWLGRMVLIDLPVTAMTLLFATTLCSDDIPGKGKQARRSGLVFSLGFLTKQSFVFFSIPMLIVWIVHQRSDWKRKAVRENVKTFLRWASISVVWYLIHWSSMLAEARQNVRDAIIEGDPMPFTRSGMTYYWEVFRHAQTNQWIFVLVAIGVLLAIGRLTWEKKFLTTWILGGYLMVTFVMVNKDGRYDLPMIPAVLLLANLGWSRLPRILFWGLDFIAGLLFVATISYYTGWYEPPILRSTTRGHIQMADLLKCDGFKPEYERGAIGIQGRKEDWRDEDFIRALIARVGPKGRVVTGVLPQSEFFNPSTFAYLVKAAQTSITITGFDAVANPATALDNVGYVIVKTGDQGPSHVTKLNAQITAVLGSKFTESRTLLELPLPDGSTARLVELRPPRNM